MRLLSSLPPGVTVLAAAKGRTPAEIEAVAAAGISHIGHNYVQEAGMMASAIDPSVRKNTTWHMIGHLQRNKTQPALRCFDVIDTLDSLALAAEIELRNEGTILPILIEINSGHEANKSGIFPENALNLIESLTTYVHIQVIGLMTMGPLKEDPEELRPFFRLTRRLYEAAALQYPTSMQILSMGMSDSYQVAIEEGATMIRIGTLLFGPRPVKT